MCPIYDFENTKTGEQFEEMMTYEDKLKYLKKNPHIIAIHVAGGQNAIIDSHKLRMSGIRKHDNGFKEVLQRIKSHHPRGTLDP